MPSPNSLKPSIYSSRKLVSVLVLALFLLTGRSSLAEPLGDCSFETSLSGSTQTVFCEPFEQSTWWSDNGYVRDGRKKLPLASVNANQMEYASVVDIDCLSGNCLKLETPKGTTRSLSIFWPMANAGIEPQAMYFRYYFKIGADYTAQACDADGENVWPPGGKFWGFADPRANTYDPGGQCGNGGAGSDGINCWTARGGFRECGTLDGQAICRDKPNARLRIGSYIYVPDNGTTHGANGLWDGIAEASSLGGDYTTLCRRDREGNRDPACYCQSEDNFYCGIGSAGELEAQRWYAIETYIKMNTPGVADGILRGWVDDQLAYEKTNILFRKDGHDNLHIRNLWLNTYKGGTFGNCEDSELFYDQLVISQEPIGMISKPTLNLSVNPASINVGDGVTVSWSSSNLDACEASGSWSGVKPLSGNESFTDLEVGQSYSMTCTGDGAEVSKTVHVTMRSDENEMCLPIQTKNNKMAFVCF